ncbi:MAG: NADP-dependent oxidoreductase [Alphaproteobacteria bacterium]|nr:NADP-dependent oxidoreductase [Alphaproteobacteria bacterium]
MAPSSPIQYRMMRYPDGAGLNGVWKRTMDPVPVLAEGDVRLRMSHISVDPGMRGWITPKRSYMPPVKPGEVMRAFGVGEVVESRAEGIAAGDWMTGFTGVQSEAALSARSLRRIDTRFASPRDYLSGLGMTGYTAYFGLLDVGQPARGETVVVSAAAGAVGSIVAQIARIRGCTVVGIAGGERKRRFLLDDLKVHEALDYRASPIAEQLAVAAPNGIDVYFDNVGGETLDAALGLINRHGRIVVCGGISQYGDMDAVRGPSNYLQLIAQSARMQGFTMRDYIDRIPEAFMALAQWRASGEILFREHVVRGIERFPEAFDMLFSGANEGKLLIEV